MNEQFSDIDIEKFHDAKQQKRTVVSLDDGQVIEFARMLQRQAPPGDFNLRFNMSPDEIERQRHTLGLINEDTIDSFLKAIDSRQPDLDREREIKEEDARRQKRLDELNSSRFVNNVKKTPSRKKTFNRSVNEQQKDLDAMNDAKHGVKPRMKYNSVQHYKEVTGKRFRRKPSEIQEGLSIEEAFERRFEEPSFRIPEDQEEQFKLDSRLGINMLCSKYGAKRSEIAAELRRLGVDLDMLPR